MHCTCSPVHCRLFSASLLWLNGHLTGYSLSAFLVAFCGLCRAWLLYWYHPSNGTQLNDIPYCQLFTDFIGSSLKNSVSLFLPHSAALLSRSLWTSKYFTACTLRVNGSKLFEIGAMASSVSGPCWFAWACQRLNLYSASRLSARQDDFHFRRFDWRCACTLLGLVGETSILRNNLCRFH